MSLTLKTAVVTTGQTEALKDGTVTPHGFAFDFEEVPVIIQAFRRMVRGLEFDVSEMAITTYVCARAHGKAFTALPVFLMRAFHHGAVLYNVNSGIRSPKDLEGRKVGVNRGYTVTTGLWARSVLQNEYGVDLKKVTWVLSGDEHVAEYQPPSNVIPIEPGKKLEDMLVSGELVAAIGAVKVESPDVKPLIPNATEAGLASLRRTGIFPINHTLVVKNELLERNPGLGARIFEAFAEAKRLYISRLKDGIAAPTANDQLFRRVMDETGSDPLPYGIEPNRKALEAVIRNSVEQGIIPTAFTVEELFDASTRELTA
jgi:ABC-type nitrate/sulfonate/bicarbonate transport system substrate-binding protein